MKREAIIIICCVLLFACKDSVEYKSTTNEIPNPQPVPETVEIHADATNDGDTLTRSSDTVNTSFITIGLGRGYGIYQVVFFKDSLQQDTIDMHCEPTEVSNGLSLRYTVKGAFALKIPCFTGITTAYWRVWYKERNIKSELRAFHIK